MALFAGRGVAIDPAANPIESLALVQAMHTSPWLYTAVLTVHTTGFALLVGAIVLFDLRVLGFSRGVSVRAFSRLVLPWCFVALLLIVPSGLLMFAAHASELLGSRAFALKMALLLAAGMNAAFFRTGPYPTVASWDVDTGAPLAARASAALSIAIWLAILACGRMVDAVIRS